jgi:hypothetical protein
MFYTEVDILRLSREAQPHRVFESAFRKNGAWFVIAKCPHHGVLKPQQYSSQIKKGKVGCPVCAGFVRRTEEDVIQEAKELDPDRDFIGAFLKNSNWRVIPKCPIHGETPPQRLGDIRRGAGCWACGGTSPLTEADVLSRANKADPNRKFKKAVRKDGRDWHVIPECPVHGETPLQRLTRVEKGDGCPACAEYGFDRTTPAILYYLRVSSPEGLLYKIGVTNRTVAERYRAYDLKYLLVLWEIPFETGEEAYTMEQEILSQFKKFRYEGDWRFSDGVGGRELFNRDVLNADNGFLLHKHPLLFPDLKTHIKKLEWTAKVFGVNL